MNDAAAAAAASSSSSSASYSSILHNYPLISAVVAFALAQSIKFFTTRYKERRWDAKQLIGSGGMPSSHSAMVTALAIAIGFRDGYGGSLFATAMTLACIVIHDAFGVRMHAGKQAELLNQIVFELPEEHPLADMIPLLEFLGPTPLQVTAGAILGLVTAVILHFISKLWSRDSSLMLTTGMSALGSLL